MARPGPGERWTILSVLSWTAERFGRAGLSSARLDAEVLLAHCLGVARVRLYMDFDKPLGERELAAFRALVQRRLAREPVAYITGAREFWSLALDVNRSVLIPRPETELLVELCLGLVPAEGPPLTIVDVGTGSGAIAVALKRERPRATVLGTDADAAALEVARRNALRHEADVTLCEGDLLGAVPEGPLDLVVANLPYIPSAALARLEPEVREWEPRAALDGGRDGLDAIRRLVPQARGRLVAGGTLLLEIDRTQATAVRALLEGEGFGEVQVHKDLAGLDRAVGGRRG